MKDKKLLLVGLWVSENDWEFCGVFDNKEQALACCINEHNFISTCEMNEPEPIERLPFEQIFYPKLTEHPKWFIDYER